MRYLLCGKIVDDKDVERIKCKSHTPKSYRISSSKNENCSQCIYYKQDKYFKISNWCKKYGFFAYESRICDSFEPINKN